MLKGNYRFVVLTVLALLLGLLIRSDTAPMAAVERGWGSGSSHFIVHYPPDPVNVQNGNFFLPIQDLFLPCYGFPLEVYRAYNSVSRDTGSFGYGWSFNYKVRIAVAPGEKLTVVEPDGFINVYTAVGSDKVDSKQIDAILTAKRKEDERYLGQQRNDAHYEKIRKKLASDAKYFRRQSARYLPRTEKSVEVGKFVSRRRGTTYIYRQKNGYERRTQDGRVERYSLDGLLRNIQDRNGNETRLRYDRQSRLTQVFDACGQYLKFGYSRQGRIQSVIDNYLRTLSYTYDDEGRMTSSRGLDGKIVRYDYEKKSGKMNKIVFPDGKQTKIFYDKKSGRVRRQQGPGKKVTNYKYRSRGRNYLAAEVSDSDGGYGKYEYFPKENKSIQTDKSGRKTVTITSACCGKPVSITDDKGKGEFYKYDDSSNLIEKYSSDGRTTLYTYEPRYYQISSVTTPDEVTTRFFYDGKGNLNRVSNSKEEELSLSYNSRGKIGSVSDKQGNLVVFEYNKTGKTTRVAKNRVKDGKERRIGEIRVAYLAHGDVDQVTYKPDDAKVVEDIRATLVDFMRILGPAGISFGI